MEETRKKVKKNHQLKENFNVLWPNKMVPTLTKQIGLGYEKLQFTTECVKCNKFTTTPNNKNMATTKAISQHVMVRSK